MPKETSLRIVVYKEDDMFIAQCLEYDICAQAKDRETLSERMEFLMECEMHEMEKTGQELDAAPAVFHNMWSKSNHAYKEVAA